MRYILGFLALIIMSSCSSGVKNSVNGDLSFASMNYSVTQGATTELKLILNNSTNTNGTIITIQSSDPKIASVVNSKCVLSDESGFINSCLVVVRGNGVGNTKIIATSLGVNSANAILNVTEDNIVTGLLFEPSLESVVVGGDSKTYLRLVSGTNVNNLEVNLSSSNSSIASLDQQTCVFNANEKVCEVTINGAGIGNTTISAVSEDYNLNAIDTINVSADTVIPGILAFSNNLQVQVGETKIAELNLVRSSGVNKFVVDFSKANTNVTINPVGVCQLSSDNPHCTVLVTGNSVGNDKIMASATNYQSAGLLVNVSNDVVKGYLSFNQSNESVTVGDETQVKLFYDGGQGVVNLPVAITINNVNASVSPSICNFDSVFPHNECTITISGYKAGQSIITASATGYANITNNVNVVPSSVTVNGELVFTPANETVKLNSTNHLQLSLINSSNVKNLNVNVVSNNSNVTLNPAKCNLSTTNNICNVTVSGNTLGNSMVTASAVVGYNSAQASVLVTNKNILPSLKFEQSNIGVPIAVTPGVGGGSSGEVLATLRLINGDSTPVEVNFPDSPLGNIQYGGWFPKQSNCILSSESPVCYFEVINNSISPVSVGTTRTAVFKATDDSILPATITSTIRNVTPTARKIKVVNNCSYDSYPAIGTGSAIVAGDCPIGSIKSNGVCYWNAPTITNINHPNDPYKLSPGESLIFEIKAGNAMDGNGNIWSGIITNRRIESGMFIYGYCGGSPVVESDKSCPLGQNPSNPYTGLEITFLGNGPTSYDIQNIQGVTVPATMSPTNYGQMVNTIDPYYGGIAGGLVTQVGSIFTLPGASWSFESSNLSAAGWPTESVAMFNYVIPSDTTQTTSNCSGQNPVCSVAGEVCGYSPWTIAQQFVPGSNVSYAMVCGKRVGYLTLTALTAMPGGSGNPAILLPFNAVLDTTGSNANSNNYPMYNFYAVSGGVGTGYGSNSDENTAGCTNWDGVTMPSSQCNSQNAAWVNNVLPGIKWSKQACPTCYSYQYDDPSSTFTNFTLIQQNTVNPTPTDGQIIELCPSGKEIK